MGERNGTIYDASYPVGTLVRIVERAILERFKAEWKYHHRIQSEQLAFGGRVGIVTSVGYYHGGDELYEIEDIPGIWHEACLESSDE